MFYKNLYLLRFTEAFTLTDGQLEEKLQGGRFQPCISQQAQSIGWVAPFGNDGAALVRGIAGRLAIAMRREEKILPAAVVAKALATKVAEIESAQGRRVKKKERDQLRDEVIFDLLPRAFSRESDMHAYIDPKAGWLVIDSPSASKAEDMASMLRIDLGRLPVAPPTVKKPTIKVMTDAVYSGGLEGTPFALGDECELLSCDEDGATIKAKLQDLTADEISNHIDSGKEVVKLRLVWHDRIEFTVDSALAIKRVKFVNLENEAEYEDEADKFDGEFALMTGEFAQCLPDLMGLFGGES